MSEATGDPTMNPTGLEDMARKWMTAIEEAIGREKKYRNVGREIVDLYEAKEPDQVPYSILYSNAEVLTPAVYNAVPVPIVQRRYKDADPIGKAASDVSTRMLKYLVGNEMENYDSFDELMQTAVLNGILTNRGLTRFKYGPAKDSYPECVFGEDIRWDKFFHGYARTWKKVPWIGFEWDMTQEEVRANFPDATLDFRGASLSEMEATSSGDNKDEMKGVNLFKVYEIWDKRTRKVMFFSACCKVGPLKVVEDPLKLINFFPVPRPMNFLRKVTTLVPTPLYQHYRQQAYELNEITRRLKALIRAAKYRGMYNSAVEGIDKMLKAEENELIPVENMQSMPEGMGMDKLIWTVPVQEIATSIQTLYQQREAVKTVIYEITGISDIIRGATAASETATAQQIKTQWGSLRLKKMQKEVQRYCRDSLAIMLEIGAKSFDMQTMVQMTGADYPTQRMKMEIQAKIEMMQQQAAMAQAQAGGQMAQPGMPPAQPQPPAQPPQIPAEIQHMLQMPSWEDIYALMQNEILLHYKTEIETNSTIDAEAAQDKQDISELLNALSQFLNGLGPLVQEGALSMDIAKQMLLVVARRYNFGSQLEDSIMQMDTSPKQPQADPSAQAKLAAVQAQAQADAARTQQEMALSKMEFEQKQALMAMEFQNSQAEARIRANELQLKERALILKVQAQTVAHNQKMELAETTAQVKKEKADASV